MVFRGGVEGCQRLHFHRQGAAVAVLHLAKHLQDGRCVSGVDVVDACAVARPLVVALPVDRSGLDAEEIEVQQLAQRQHLVVIHHAHRLGIARRVGVHLFVGGPLLTR